MDVKVELSVYKNWIIKDIMYNIKIINASTKKDAAANICEKAPLKALNNNLIVFLCILYFRNYVTNLCEHHFSV